MPLLNGSIDKILDKERVKMQKSIKGIQPIDKLYRVIPGYIREMYKNKRKE